MAQNVSWVMTPAEAERSARRAATHEQLRQALIACRDYLSAIPESAAGGDDEAVRLARIASAAIANATGA